jgi:4-amino-4-deoxy-L-arabinose transferase-like glycosyltransferase
LICFYVGLGDYGLLNNNEGLYASIGQTMWQTGNYSIPHLNGVPYIEKPPLLYWLSALSYQLLGMNEFAARFFPATAGVISCLTLYGWALYGWGRKLNQTHIGLMAAGILATSLGFVLFSRMVFFDGLLTCFLTLAFAAFYFFYTSDQRRYLRFSYAFLALAILSKGLVAGILFALVILTFLNADRSFVRFFKKLFDPWALLIFLAIALPWHIIATIQEPGFAWFYFVNEHFLRFLDLKEPRDYYHGPIYYYIPRLAAYLVPWTPLLRLLFMRSATSSSSDSSLLKFLWCWFLVPLVFFSISQAKANYYMMVGMPPLAFLLALKIDDVLTQNKTFWFWTTLMGSCLFSISIFVALLYFLPQQGLIFSDSAPLIIIGSAILLISLIAFGYAFLKNFPYGALTCVGFSAIGLLLILINIAADNESYFSSKSLATHILKDPVDTIYLYQDFEMLSSLAFYLNRPLIMVDSQSRDLWYGQKTRPTVFLNINQFKEQLSSKQRIYVIGRSHSTPALKNLLENHAFTETYSSHKETLWKNF